MEAGDKIYQYRRSKGLTQAELANLAGVSKAAISRYESGDREPRLKHLHAIAKAMGINPLYLLPSWFINPEVDHATP
jgi:transcriptional regulator with XRE-family HTH domain